MYKKCKFDNFDSDSIIVEKIQSERILIGNKEYRLCRFCGKGENIGATFRTCVQKT